DALVKRGHTDIAHVHYLYRVLGTPRVMNYTNFDALPLSKQCGHKIFNKKEQSKTDAKCVLIRELGKRIHPHVHRACQLPAETRSPYMADGSGYESYGDAAVEMLFTALQLVPSSRPSLAELLQCRLFTMELEVPKTEVGAAPRVVEEKDMKGFVDRSSSRGEVEGQEMARLVERV
ncbi:unnamed protein product, partial [Symbiodinium microadriaticum]